jgi:hypothetical protein
LKKFFILVLALSLLVGACASEVQEEDKTSEPNDQENVSAASTGTFDTENYLLQLLESEQGWMEDVDKMLKVLTEANGIVPDNAVIGFEHYLKNVATFLTVSELTQSVETQPLFKKNDDHEGGQYFGVNYTELKRVLGPKVSEAYSAYFEEVINEEAQDVMGDAAILVTWDELKALMLRWDRFEHKYPDFTRIQTSPGGIWNLYSSEGKAKDYLYLYLGGSDNSPIYDYETNVLLPELRSSYEGFLADDANASFQYYESVKKAYDLWKLNEWTYSENLSSQLNDLL